MQLHDLKPNPGAVKDRKRLGRGNSSGTGTTAGKGTKGQLSRSGGGKGAGFEGGQMPLANRNRETYAPVNVSRLEALFEAGDTVDVDALVAKGVVKHTTDLVKVLGDGELTKALTVKVDKVSASAAKKIEAAGGKVA